MRGGNGKRGDAVRGRSHSVARQVRLVLAQASLVFAIVSAGSSTWAADLDRGVAGPSVIQGAGYGACRLVPEPQFNLHGDVTRFRPIFVCASRGVYADTFWPENGPP